MDIKLGQGKIKLTDIKHFEDKGYYIYLETQIGIFTVIGEEAIMVRDLMVRFAIGSDNKKKQYSGSGVNCVDLMGYVEWEPEVSYKPNGTHICKFLVRTDVILNENDVHSFWHIILANDILAQYCAENLKNNHMVRIKGYLDANIYYDETQKPHLETIVIAQNIEVIEENI